MPSATIMAQALKPPKQVPARPVPHRRTCSRARPLHSLASTFTAPGKPRKLTQLVGREGGRYTGEVVSGHPHGSGQMLAPCRAASGKYVLLYDGDWFQGVRHGQGTQYFANGEVYCGSFCNNERHGWGRMEFADGSVYEGEWQHGRRNGVGRIVSKSGDVVFAGSFVDGHREGQGCLLLINQDIKHVCEYSKGRAYCGTVLPLAARSLSPLSSALEDHIASVTAQRADVPRPPTCTTPPLSLPPLLLSQPCKVLLDCIAHMRNERRSTSRVLRKAQAGSGTFDGDQLQMLRHAFVTLCGGDGEEAGLRPEELPELAVMAGLDVADPATSDLISSLSALHSATTDKKLHFDDFLRVVTHYRRPGTPGFPDTSATTPIEALGCMDLDVGDCAALEPTAELKEEPVLAGA